jgi:hypothetical protein
MGFVVDKVALGHVFSKYFGFPCQFSFSQMLHRAGKFVADVPSGLCLNPRNKKKTLALDGGLVRLTSRPLYGRGNSLWHPLDKRLSGLQCRSVRSEEEKISITAGNQLPVMLVNQPVV